MINAQGLRLRCRRHYRHPLGIAGSLARRPFTRPMVPEFEPGDLVMLPNPAGSVRIVAWDPDELTGHQPAEIAIPAREPAFVIGDVRRMRAADGTVLSAVLVDVHKLHDNLGQTLEWFTAIVDGGCIADRDGVAQFTGSAFPDVERRVLDAAATVAPGGIAPLAAPAPDGETPTFTIASAWPIVGATSHVVVTVCAESGSNREWFSVAVSGDQVFWPEGLSALAGPKIADLHAKVIEAAAAMAEPPAAGGTGSAVYGEEPDALATANPADVIAAASGLSADHPLIERIREACDEPVQVAAVEPDPPAEEVVASLLDACAGPVAEAAPEEPGRQPEPEPASPVDEQPSEPETAIAAAMRKARERKRISFYPRDPFAWFDLKGIAMPDDVLVAPGAMVRGTVWFRDGAGMLVKVTSTASAVVPLGAVQARWVQDDPRPIVEPEAPLPDTTPNPEPSDEPAPATGPDPVDATAEAEAAEEEAKAAAGAAPWTDADDHKLLFGASKGTDPATIAAVLGRFEEEVYDRLDELVPGWGENPKVIEKALRALKEKRP